MSRCLIVQRIVQRVKVREGETKYRKDFIVQTSEVSRLSNKRLRDDRSLVSVLRSRTGCPDGVPGFEGVVGRRGGKRGGRRETGTV